jgi:carbamate kinase
MNATMTRTALIAIGGNALVLDGEAGSIPRQQERSAQFADQVADLVVGGWTVVVTHGNGPQVGFILRRGELVAPDAQIEGLPELPLWLAVADSQGGIGHLLSVAIDSALARRGSGVRAAAVLTHVEVDPADPAFAAPTKPIGSVLSKEAALLRQAQEGWTVTETRPGTFRRVVASPAPRRILEAEQIATLVASGCVVIAAGGGGIPVVRDDAGWSGVDAVIDKDRASAVLAAQTGVETLVLVTGVERVCTGFGTPRQRELHHLDAEEARALLAAGEFPAGSMGPKIESALAFLAAGGRETLITSLPALTRGLQGSAGTRITSGVPSLASASADADLAEEHA